MSARDALDVAMLIGVKAAVGALVLLSGFRAVSDDDFARVVIAERWAADPVLDPSGTSWLPVPFWLAGGAMRVFGATLTVARVQSFLLGLLSVAVIYVAAQWLTADRNNARVGTLIAAVIPWSARLGVATVPELPTAALALLGLAALTQEKPGRRQLGALALSVACLCRYEAWPLAAGFAALCVFDARKPRHRAASIAAALLASTGALMWLGYNMLEYGSPFRFAFRVSGYSNVLGSRALALVSSYPLSLVRDEPELSLVSFGLVLGTILSRRALPRSLARPATLATVMFVALSVAAYRGSAPTHHAGRSLLVIWLLAALYLPGGLRAAWSSRRGLTAAGLGLALAISALVVRPHLTSFSDLTAREDEVRLGHELARILPAGHRALLDMRGYRHYAVQAASARPDDLILDPDLPRRSARDEPTGVDGSLPRRAQRLGVSFLVTEVERAGEAFGAPIAQEGPWGLFRSSSSALAAPRTSP